MSHTILKMLDVSTEHITKGTSILLDNADTPRASVNLQDLFITPWRETGWIIAVPESTDPVLGHLSLVGHRALAKILQKAQDLDCHYVKLHADGELYPYLETFDW